ncbi:phage tail protein [Brucella pseudogrignonensis]|uniref:Phage tail protein n=1 Tax=Brucella pseudogrignonensis TaxID=419475 RepID=A0ABU1M5K3_9HYPH|nr:phage tail protein [Brucella pseudogrignonensis]MDR6431306.1 hypothetical protein [Brucella pseudogrignonensis]
MSNRQALLPSNATALETAFSEALDRTPELSPGIVALRGFKFNPNSSIIPYLILEYGLEEIEEFFTVRREVIFEGVDWRRLVGTPTAVHKALSWIGYEAAIEEEWFGRRKWNTFQLRFPSLPAQDFPDLPHIEKIAEISTPLRSRFRRGVHLYDAGALIADCSRLDDSMLERESGVDVTGTGAIWSFGRTHEIDHTLSRAEGLSLGNWIDPEIENTVRWLDLIYPWQAAVFPWSAQPDEQRRALMAAWFVGKLVHICLRNLEGDVIGYRRCRAVHTVEAIASGAYRFGSKTFGPLVGGQQLYVEAMTDFVTPSRDEVSEVSIVVGGLHAQGVKAGALWLNRGQLVGGVEVANEPVSFQMRKTVREQIKYLVRF